MPFATRINLQLDIAQAPMPERLAAEVIRRILAGVAQDPQVVDVEVEVRDETRDVLDVELYVVGHDQFAAARMALDVVRGAFEGTGLDLMRFDLAAKPSEVP